MKIQIEFNYVRDNEVYLNFWNSLTGEDIIYNLIDDKLIDEDGNEKTIQEFAKKVKETYLKSLEEIKK